MKTVINIEEVEALLKRKEEINAVPLVDIQWLRDGKPMTVSEEVLENWRFIGMGNCTFVEMRYWETLELLA